MQLPADIFLDANNMIILYPQAIPDNTIHAIWNGVLPNSNGCWDWVGWYGNNADQIGGKSPECTIWIGRN